MRLPCGQQGMRYQHQFYQTFEGEAAKKERRNTQVKKQLVVGINEPFQSMLFAEIIDIWKFGICDDDVLQGSLKDYRASSKEVCQLLTALMKPHLRHP